MKKPDYVSLPQWMDQPDTWRSFAFSSINFTHLLPEIPLKHHAAYFDKMKRLQQLNTFDNSYRQLDDLAQTGAGPTDITAPAIVATFHTGPYQLVCGWLMRKRIPFSLVLSADVIETQSNNYRKLYQRVTGEQATSEEFGIIDASNNLSLLHMRSVLRKGHLLVLYVDGNMGAGGRSAQGKQVQLQLSFLSGTLQVKTGAAYLSHLMQCPVFPVACTWEHGQAVWQTAQRIMPRKGEARELYVRRCMTGIYRLLAGTLQKDASQWEGWEYVHHDLAVQGEATDFRHLDHDELIAHFVPVRFGGRSYLLQRDGLFAHPIPDDYHSAVWSDSKKFFGI